MKDQKITDTQLKFIEIIEEFVDEKFKGTTKEDAFHYIRRNINKYKLILSH